MAVLRGQRSPNTDEGMTEQTESEASSGSTGVELVELDKNRNSHQNFAVTASVDGVVVYHAKVKSREAIPDIMDIALEEWSRAMVPAIRGNLK